MSAPKELLRLFLPLAFVTVLFLSFSSDDNRKGELLANQYCSSCHLVPHPGSLPKYIWQQKVLPIMASYMGVPVRDNNPSQKLTDTDGKQLSHQTLDPVQPAISMADWQKIVAYYVDNAPTNSEIDSSRLNRNQPIRLFATRLVSFGKATGANVTALAYDTTRQELWVAEPDKLYRWKWSRGLTHNYDIAATIVDIKFTKKNTLLTDIGTLLPSELSQGALFSLADDHLYQLQSQLHRPVYSLAADLNNDGIDELITANYGHRSGSLSLYTKQAADTTYTEHILLNIPGAIKCYVQDLNNDGRKDIVALFAQNTESIYFFYQTDKLTFVPKKVLQFEPQYGTSDFIIFDYNKDGVYDLAVVHGDNADYSNCLKSFHGLRVFLGDKNGRYTQAYFYPLYGATRLQADDFDQDGDIDFAISAFFPELTQLASESFIYLENTNSSAFHFNAYTCQTPIPIKSLTLEKADVDQDGDMDLLLGPFAYSPVNVPAGLQQSWNTIGYKLIVLVNQYKP